MLRQVLTSSYMAGVALATFAHGGVLAGIVLLAPAGPSGLGPKEDAFLVTLVEDPAPVPQQLPEPDPPPPVKDDAPPLPIPEVDTAPAPTSSKPADVAQPLPAPEPASYEPVRVEPSAVTLIDSAPTAVPQAAQPVPVPEQAASFGAVSPGGDGKAMRDAYLRYIRLKLARHSPRGVRGAGNCEVEFQLSRAGEVVFVGIQTSSGSRLYDRRCLKAVTSSVPFPDAPIGVAESDLHFTIVMRQTR